MEGGMVRLFRYAGNRGWEKVGTAETSLERILTILFGIRLLVVIERIFDRAKCLKVDFNCG